jgi:hypothetical protein
MHRRQNGVALIRETLWSIRLAELTRFSRLLQETEHFCGWRQEKLRRVSRMRYHDMTKVARNTPAAFVFCQAVLVRHT